MKLKENMDVMDDVTIGLGSDLKALVSMRSHTQIEGDSYLHIFEGLGM